MNKNNAPERIDPYAGTYFTKEIPQKNDLSIWAVGCDGDSHVADFTGSNARRMADEYRDWKNAMQPQVSEGDEAVAPNFQFNVTKAGLAVGPDGQQAVWLDDEIALYINLDHPRWAEIQAYLAKHRQPAAVSADAVAIEREVACTIHAQLLDEIDQYKRAMDTCRLDVERRMREVIGYAIARLEDDEVDQALSTLKVARGDYVRDHYPDDNSRMAVKQLRDAVNGLDAPIDYADALLRYIEQLERRALSPETVCGGE